MSEPIETQWIENVDFFAGLDRKLLSKISRASVLRSYPSGTLIVRQGDVGLGVYLILRGRVEVEKEHNGVVRKLAELGPRQFFAEMALIDSKPRSANVRALVDTDCMLLTRDSFLKLVQKHPELSLRLARVLAERLRDTDEKLTALEQTPAPGSANQGSAAGMARTDPTPARTSAAPLTKARVQESMLDLFQSLYAMKAMIRFSVAVLGCPVEGFSPDLIDALRVGDTKVLLLPVGCDVELRARARGSFTLHVFVPDRPVPFAFGPVDILPSDRFQLRVADGTVALWQTHCPSVGNHP